MQLGRPKSPVQWCIWADPNLQFSDAFGLTQISKSVIQLGRPKSPVQWRSWVDLNLQFSYTTLKYYLVVCWLALFLAYHRSELCPLSASYILRFQHPYSGAMYFCPLLASVAVLILSNLSILDQWYSAGSLWVWYPLWLQDYKKWKSVYLPVRLECAQDEFVLLPFHSLQSACE